jgi:hypothetical protein
VLEATIYLSRIGTGALAAFTPGLLTTLACNRSVGYPGDGGIATSAELQFPTGVTTDAAGTIYIADEDNARISKVAQLTQ